MKNICRMMAVAVVMFAVVTVYAADTVKPNAVKPDAVKTDAVKVNPVKEAVKLDGNYTFVARTKDGKPDLVNWTGTMKIGANTMTRNFKSPDGRDTKSYETLLKNEGGNVYLSKMTKAYKPEYVGLEMKNKLIQNGNEFIMESVDGKFKETWKKN